MRFLLIVMLLFVGCANAPWVPIPSDERQSEIIIENLNKNKDKLFDLTIEWIAKSFVDSKNVIEHKSKDDGLIIGMGYMNVSAGIIIVNVGFSLTINVKDNRIRMKYENYSYSNGGPIQKGDRFWFDNIYVSANNLSKSLEKYIINSDNQNKW